MPLPLPTIICAGFKADCHELPWCVLGAEQLIYKSLGCVSCYIRSCTPFPSGPPAVCSHMAESDLCRMQIHPCTCCLKSFADFLAPRPIFFLSACEADGFCSPATRARSLVCLHSLLFSDESGVHLPFHPPGPGSCSKLRFSGNGPLST